MFVVVLFVLAGMVLIQGVCLVCFLLSGSSANNNDAERACLDLPHSPTILQVFDASGQSQRASSHAPPPPKKKVCLTPVMRSTHERGDFMRRFLFDVELKTLELFPRPCCLICCCFL